VTYNVLKDYDSGTHLETCYIFRPILFMDGFALKVVYLSEMVAEVLI
jgi:hypothetical protein